MKNFSPLLLLFFALNVFSQKEANFWYFGENAGLDFNSGVPVAISDGKLNTLEGCSSISNSDGELLFYSDGTILYNKNHEIMTFVGGIKAENLGGNPSSTQSALFVPNPVDENIYYLFTVGTNYVGTTGVANPGFNFYTITIDPAVNGGLGTITGGPTNLAISPTTGFDLSIAWSEKVTAVQGGCDSIWILSVVQNQIYAYEISASGVNFENPVVSDLNYTPLDKRGYLKVSPDGKKIALADFNASGSSSGNGSLVLFNFNDQTGEVDYNGNILTSPLSDGDPYGVEFSQQSNKLYTSTYDGENKIFQFDLTEVDVAATKRLIISQTGYRSALQLAPDGKIYNSIPENNFLGAIENPNDDADDIRYAENAISLGSARATQGLPPFIQSFFSPVNIVSSLDSSIVLSSKTQKVCIDEVLVMEPEIEETIGSTFQYFWTKEGDSSVNIKTRSISIDNNNLGSGIYYLEIVSVDQCGKERKYNSSIKIEFTPIPKVNNIPIYTQCDFDTNSTDYITSFNLTTKESEIYTGFESVNIEFFELSDTSFSNPVNKEIYRNTTPTSPTNGNHKLVVRVTNSSSFCSDLGEIELKVNPSSSSISYTDLYTCELDQNSNNPESRNSSGTSSSYYDLDAKTTEIINNSGGSLSNSTHDFSYYKTIADAGLQNNKIEKPYESTLFNNGDDVFIRISLKGSGACETIGSFKIYIKDLPIPKGNTSPIILCVSNPIVSPQANTVDLDASTVVSGDSYVWYRNGTLLNASNTPVLKANQEGRYRVEVFRTYTNAPSNTLDDFDCMGYNTFDVIESNVALIESVEFVDNQDNPDKNTITIKVTGKGDYEYALNNNSITNFNKGVENLTFTFTNVTPGLNTVYIRDRNSCGTAESQKLSFIYVQRHFTPDGDNNFDFWTVQGINNSFYTSVKINIFDRFGKLLKTADLKTDNGWNGISNGKMMPSNDYWYNLVLIDINGNTRKEVGHFSLLRR